MADRHTILRHIETSVDVDEWATVGVKENFEKLDKIEQILDRTKEINGYPLNEIREVLNG